MNEDLIKAAILGIVQGLTEFLPISSTGHLILAERVLGVDKDTYGLPFDVSLHMGTLIAILIYFRRRWLSLARGGIHTLQERSLGDAEGRLAWLIVLGTIPAGIIGLLLESKVEDAFRNAFLVATMLIAFSAVFVAAEAIGKRTRDMHAMRWFDSVFVGFGQALALVPGVSRSGATICAGLFRDLKRPEAATFAFLLSAPIIAGAGLKEMPRIIGQFADGTRGGDDFLFFLTGFLFSFVVGYVAVAFLMRFLRTNTLIPFVWYRVGLGLFIYAVLLVQNLS